MKNIRILILLSIVLCCGLLSCTKIYTDVTIISQIEDTNTYKVGIVAHRGYWNCSEGGYAKNSVASLRSAQLYGFWGSEFDLHLTADEVIVVCHDDAINGIQICDSPYSEIADFTLNNGELLPTIDDYLSQAVINPNTRLVCEFKAHPSSEQEDRLIELTVLKLKDYDLYDPNRIVFISFSKHVCEVIASEMPEFSNQYLGGDYDPEELAKMGINGVDYQYDILISNSTWCDLAHSYGMTVNCWTVNDIENIEAVVDLGVDFITTDYPDMVRDVLNQIGISEK